ncbi:MAG: M48 family metalloprotease [Frankiaceae bacterium]|nr:M48 family metalloprotease [Frankiaceae bacterium]MBV9872904.1 M48 family metalloprotease [Frankiaceae bacterium]
MGTATCPECSAPVPTEIGWTPWCSECNWNLDPIAEPPQTWITRWQRRVLDEATRREHALLLKRAATDPGNHPLNRLVKLLAVSIHTVTILILGGAAAVWFLPIRAFFSGALSLLLVLIAIGVMPFDGNLNHWRRRAQVHGWTRADAPNVFTLLDLVAASIDAPTPDRVLVTQDVNASIHRWERQTVLTIGIPLWGILDDKGRLALLGHEIGHQVNGDLRKNALVRPAILSLNKWLSLLWPSTARERASLAGHRLWMGSQGGQLVIGDLLLPVLFAPLFLLALTVGRTFEVCLSRSSQRAEYRADRMSVRVGGTVGACEAMDAALYADLVAFKLSIDARAGRQSSIDGLREAVAKVPEHERERLRRRERARMQRVDETHPPTTLRRAYVEAAPRVEHGVTPPAGLMPAVTRELYR